MTRKDFSEICKILVGLDAAVPKVRTAPVLAFKTGGRNRIFIPAYRSSPFPFLLPSSPPTARSYSPLQLGRWNPEKSGECWLLLFREGIRVLVFYAASLSALGVCCIACTISALYALVPQLTSYILKSTIKQTPVYLLWRNGWKRPCISVSQQLWRLLQGQQSNGFCNPFVNIVPIYH